MDTKNRISKIGIALLILLSMLLVACGSDSSESKNAVTIGAEGEPDCLDPIDSCASDAWEYYTVTGQTLPRTYKIAKNDDGNWVYKPTDLLTKAATVTADPQQTITYTLNPEAQWSDGEPITVDDFTYTWHEIAEGKNIIDPSGYDNIEGIKAGKDNEVVVTLKDQYAAWHKLFAGSYGLLPSHILKGKDRNAETKDGYTWSGGPFKLKEWDKGKSLTIVRNDNYWGDKAELDEVTFDFMKDANAEVASIKNDEVDAIYPRPGVEVSEAFSSGDFDDFNNEINTKTGSVEALWFNNGVAPFNDLNVRKAVLSSLDRDAIVKSAYGTIGDGVDKAAQSFLPGVLSQFALTAFDQYTVDESRADELLQKSGYKKNSDGKWAKNGKLLEFKILTTAGDTTRQDMMESIQKQLEDKGWTVTLSAEDDLFTLVDAGEYQSAIFQQIATILEPDNCSIFCTSSIPTEQNDFSGYNSFNISIPELDELLAAVDTEIDETKRQSTSKQSEQIIADQAVSAPLAPVPNVLIWNKKITGNVMDNPLDGPFATLNEWKLS